MLRTTLLALALLAPLWFAGAADEALAQAECLSRHEQRAEIRAGRVIRPGRLRRRVGGKVLRIRLCRGGAGLHWRVTVLSRDGEVRNTLLDARDGRLLR